MFDDSLLPPPADITAEWTVHAQLTISHGNNNGAGENVNGNDPAAAAAATPSNCHRENVTFVAAASADDGLLPPTDAPNCCPGHNSKATVTAAPASGQQSQPLRVVYKWSSDDLRAAGCHRQGSFSGAREQRVSCGFPAYIQSTT